MLLKFGDLFLLLFLKSNVMLKPIKTFLISESVEISLKLKRRENSLEQNRTLKGT